MLFIKCNIRVFYCEGVLYGGSPLGVYLYNCPDVGSEATWIGLFIMNGVLSFRGIYEVGKGVYVYKLLVRSMLSNTKAVKIEKLVVLQ